MKVIPTAIPDVLIIEPKVFGDHRGFFMESWNRQTFREAGLDLDFVQDNHSRSSNRILRGLHYQLNQPQGKLVRVTQGEVFDVAVDLRNNSPTFGKWAGVHLTDKNHQMLWVPPGFAHGFYVISELADFHYKCTDYYAPHDEHCIRWDDPGIGIEWPFVKDKSPILSDKDAAGCMLMQAEVYP